MNELVRKNVLLSHIVIALFLCLFPCTSFAGGSWNGWIYQDPYPTSNSLYAVKFVTPQKGWVAGEQGTILYTEDGGDTWEAQESGTEQTLTSITFVNEKTGWAATINGTVIHTEDGGKTWRTQTEIKTPLKSLFFLNEKEGWAAGAAVFHTTDGGKTWARVNIAMQYAAVSVQFINPQVGWVLSGDEVYRTQDGGKTWEESKLDVALPQFGYPYTPNNVEPPLRPSGPDIFQVWSRGELTFTDSKNGWAVVGFGSIMHTADGGKTWTNQNLAGALAYGLNRLSFNDSQTGCAVGSSILCTEDGGQTWKEKLGVPAGSGKIINHFHIDLVDVSFGGKSTGWAVGMEGQILKTEDAGKTWKMAARRDECGGKTFFVNKKTGWFFGNHAFICRTDDGGRTLKKQNLEFEVESLYFLDDLKGWAVGCLKEKKPGAQTPGFNEGKLWNIIKFTRDGGKTWVTQLKDLVSNDLFYPGLMDVYFNSPSRGWAVGYKGTIIYTNNGGNTWKYQKKPEDPELIYHKVWFIDSQIGWVIGAKITEVSTGIILNTNDGGRHWSTQYQLKGDAVLASIFFMDSRSGWITGETTSSALDYVGDGLLFHTVDGGKTWSEKEFNGIDRNRASFIDKNRGVLVSEDWIMITTDGGATWKKTRKPIRRYPWRFSEIFGSKQKRK